MSANGTPQPAHIIAKCSQCQGDMTLIMPAFRIMNSPELTLIALVHEKAQVCPKCGAGYVPIVKALTPDGRMDIQWSKVDYSQRPVIVPPTPQQQQAIEKTKAKSGLVEP